MYSLMPASEMATDCDDKEPSTEQSQEPSRTIKWDLLSGNKAQANNGKYSTLRKGARQYLPLDVNIAINLQ